MAKKFDTNPLDPDFPEQIHKTNPGFEESADAYKTSDLKDRPSITEQETRKFSNADFTSYSFQGGQAPARYETAAIAQNETVKLGSTKSVPVKWLIGLPYIPFSVGLIAGLILLLVIPKHEAKLRFHAAQGLAAHAGILIVTAILGVLDNVTGLADIANFIFTICTTIMLIIFAIKAWSGKPVHIESVDDLTNWLEEKIGPMKNI